MFTFFFFFFFFCPGFFLHSALIGRCTATAVIRFSVPEDHHVCLQCGGSDSSDVVWTHRDRKVATRRGSYETNVDRQRYLLQAGGGLCLLRLDESDGGKILCNQQLVAELQVLTGSDFAVSAGRTLLLPCSDSRTVKKWFHQREGARRWAPVLTRFRNGTARAERTRLSLGNDALQIEDLRAEDAGRYKCNGERLATLSVLPVPPEPTSIEQTSSTIATAAVTDVVETKTKEEKKRPENALLMVAVGGLAVMSLLMAAVCVLLTGMRCRRKKKHRRAAQRHEDTELQSWTTSNTQTECEVPDSPSPPEETIHYASLGRQNWRERPSRPPPDQDHHNVIYSSVITRPAAKQKRHEMLHMKP
ncbi:uncharacterized protein LOC116691930 [Etheostoma spectabile]|uniref:uncharacterized protein LOC116691930 n=1 Tax=Etheostoma spectabile TaxID=54343 RepID=UPI0013AF14B2|nr:uncharacterized protein LOC116691930 [Etheostoma spectabile]